MHKWKDLVGIADNALTVKNHKYQ